MTANKVVRIALSLVDCLLARTLDRLEMEKKTLVLFNIANVINRSSYPEILTPREYNEFIKYNHLVLGHVSSFDHLESIRLKGIVPQSDGATNVEDSLPTDEKNVYLCIDSQCGFYLSRIHRELKAKGIIIIVEVPVNKLRADVNALMPKDMKESSLRLTLLIF